MIENIRELQKRNQQAHQQELEQLRVIVAQSTETILSSASFQNADRRLLIAVETTPPGCESKSLSTNGAQNNRQKSLFQSKRRIKLKARFQTPKWLFGVSRAIEIYDSQANSGWNFNIQIYNVVPAESPIFEMVRDGDIVGIQHLFSTRQASPFDREENGWTLLDVRCRYVLQK